ncbi:hypothetical protein FPZ12_016125 [Amycolatopsis acidicola]|uniref:Uncharacterized protein n=1 Tax=Amycolatopsis acidicola TaxID=2596893 RepID=A0A5N0V5L1_9PSEU|nr:hypothetical protein [Amycolatopsis acidicola]KAA9160678.1 hypothetical protein FPZ12_016125 [Amycolatopsis acidicola]
MDILTAQLVQQGVRLVHQPKSWATPGGGYGARFFDGDGYVAAVSSDVATRQHRAIEKREDIPVRLSQFEANSGQPEGTVQWLHVERDGAEFPDRGSGTGQAGDRPSPELLTVGEGWAVVPASQSASQPRVKSRSRNGVVVLAGPAPRR